MLKKTNLGGVNSQDGIDAVKQRYNLWAKEYNQDLGNVNYNLPMIMASIANSYIVDKNSKILDAGAGTGLSGLALHKSGFTNISAVDFSREMLAHARKLKCYKEIIEDDLSNLNIESESYDHTIAVGTVGVAPSTALKEIVRVTKKNGLIIFSNRTNEQYDSAFGFEHLCLEMIEKGTWKLIEKKSNVIADSRSGTSPFVIFIYKKLGKNISEI